MTCKICGREEDPSLWIDDWRDSIIYHKMCHRCNFWRELLEEDAKRSPHTVCMIDGTHYIIGPEDSDSHFRGFGGAKFQIEFNDGTRVVTTNLWCQGEPDGYWKEKFPDNAHFFEEDYKWKNINGTNYLINE